MELDKQIGDMNHQIMDQRKQMGGINAARESNQQTQRQIKILENRLEKALVKYNEALGKNKKLKEQIDNLRRERKVFDEICKKLEKVNGVAAPSLDGTRFSFGEKMLTVRTPGA